MIVVTGGNGVLGRAVVARLRDDGRDVRVVSRKSTPSADLVTGVGVADALRGAEVIVHCATSLNGDKDIVAAKTLVAAAGGAHLVFVSIVGIDEISYGYYRGKLACERIIAASGLPHTILRATQFHDLLRVVFAGAAKLPLMFVPGFRFQPVDVRDVAARLVELAGGAPVGRAPDLGGPEVRTAVDLAGAYLAATGRRRVVVPVRWPGRVFRAFHAGGNLVPAHADGLITFERYLAEHPRRSGMAYR